MALETVLLAVGQSDQNRFDALATTVADVAGPAGANVVLLHVFTDEEFEDAASSLDFDNTGDATPEGVASRLTAIRDLAESLDDAGIAYEITGRIGEHGESIVSEAISIDADMVIVGGRKRSPSGKAVFGSTAQQVMLNAPCPVTFVRQDR